MRVSVGQSFREVISAQSFVGCQIVSYDRVQVVALYLEQAVFVVNGIDDNQFTADGVGKGGFDARIRPIGIVKRGRRMKRIRAQAFGNIFAHGDLVRIRDEPDFTRLYRERVVGVRVKADNEVGVISVGRG